MIIGEQETPQARIHRYAQTCELLFGQPIGYYQQQIEKQFVAPIDFSRYYVMITGLPRQVYRPFFGMDAFAYSSHFKQVEAQIVQLLERQSVRCMTTMLLYDHTKRFCMIFNTPPSVCAMDVAHTAACCFDQLYARIFDMRQIPYRNYTALSSETRGYENLPQVFQQIDALSRQQFFDGHTNIMTPALLEQLCRDLDKGQLHEDLAHLRIALRSKNVPAVEKALDQVMGPLASGRNFSYLEKALYAIRLSAEGLLAASGRELCDPEVFAIHCYPTFAHLRRGITQELLHIVASLPDGPALSAPVLEAMRYIRRHYGEDISLSDIAKHIDMSTSWLTKHFNRECGMSIPAYLLNVRVEHAQRLLLDTHMLVFEVGNAAGFRNPRYFAAAFKKATGMTPTAYRDQAHQSPSKSWDTPFLP